MIADFHFLRPYWFIAALPLALIILRLFRRRSVEHAWTPICDSHLLPWIIKNKGTRQRTRPLLWIMIPTLLMIISLSGPTWSRFPVPTYQHIQPRVIVLSMAHDMLNNDLSPNRLSRARFKIHDLLQHKNAGQFGLVVYTGEPFVVSPLTDDGQTIDALLSTLTPDIMPIDGNRLDRALEQAKALITQAGSDTGQILVLTASPPSSSAIRTAKKLAVEGIETSVIPMVANASIKALFTPLAAGHGRVLSFTDTQADINQWLATSQMSQRYGVNQQHDIPIWRDQGRWFLIPVLLFLLPIFQRGWLQRIGT